LRYAAAARVAAGDRSPEAVREFTGLDANERAAARVASRQWLLDRQRLHPEYAGPLKRPRVDELLPANPRGSDVPLLRVDPNTAPPQVLGTLPGVGPTLRKAIVEAREQALFKSAQDMDRRVRGIGKKTIDNLTPHLRFPGQGDVDPRGADRAFADVLGGRPPRLLGPVGQVPGISSRETPMKAIDPAEIRYDRDVSAAETRGASAAELRKILGDHFRRVVAPATRPGPRAAVGRGSAAGEAPGWRTDGHGLVSASWADLGLGGLLPTARELPPPASSVGVGGLAVGDRAAQELSAAAKDFREAVREFRQGTGPGPVVGQSSSRGGAVPAPLPATPPVYRGRM